MGAAALAGLALLILMISRTSVFGVRHVEVRGVDHLSRAQVVELAGLGGSANVPWLDEGAVERRLETDPWIAGAEVSTRLPWTIRVEIVERSPIARVGDGALETLLTADGTRLGRATAAQRLPWIRLPDARAYEGSTPAVGGATTAIGAMSPALRSQVAEVSLLGDGTMLFRMRGGVMVRYGDAARHAGKARALERVLAWARWEGLDVASVSLVAPGAPAVRLAPA